MLRIASMLCGFSILAVGCGASQHSQPQPKSTAPPPHALGAPQLLAHAPGLSLFAQDGDDIAWWSSGACPALHIEVLATRSDARIPPGRSCAISDDTGFPSVWSLAFAGGRALWSIQTQGHSVYEALQTASLTDSKIRPLREISYDDSAGTHLEGMAGDGATLVFTTYSLDQVASGFSIADAETSLAGTSVVQDGIAVAVSGRLGAFVHPERLDARNRPFTGDSEVEIRDVRSGELLQHFGHDGQATAFALSPEFLATLVHDGPSTRIETYSVSDGDEQGKAEVPTNATDLSIAGDTVVFRVGEQIYAANAKSGRRSVVAVAKGRPVGLSIEGRRIAWGEQHGADSSIVAVGLSGG